MIEVKDKKDCCGCWACENVCSKQCIQMIEDKEGFRYPVVDVDICISCGLCEKVCPESQKKVIEPFNQRAFVVQNKDEKVLRESTSGGFFSSLALWVLRQDGVVFGCCLNKDFEAVHTFVERYEDVGQFRNSKYVQSVIGHAYSDAKRLLQNGRMVLFSGTPCQIEGLLNYLRKPYENLYTVDVVCRAVPSPMVLRKYLDMQSAKTGTMMGVKFRDKYHGYKYSTMSLYTQNGMDYHEGIDTDVYLRSFFSGVNIRPSCTDCKFRSRYRVSDFTIWDCYNIGDFCKELDNDKGVTRVLCHSERSLDIIRNLNDLKVFEVDSEKAVKGVKEMVSGPQFHPKRDVFFKAMNDDSLTTEEVFQMCFPITMRHRIEKKARLWSDRLGVYQVLKKILKYIIGKKEISR